MTSIHISMTGELIAPKMVWIYEDKTPVLEQDWITIKKQFNCFLTHHQHLLYKNYTPENCTPQTRHDFHIKPESPSQPTAHEMMSMQAFFNAIPLPYL